MRMNRGSLTSSSPCRAIARSTERFRDFICFSVNGLRISLFFFVADPFHLVEGGSVALVGQVTATKTCPGIESSRRRFRHLIDTAISTIPPYLLFESPLRVLAF